MGLKKLNKKSSEGLIRKNPEQKLAERGRGGGGGGGTTGYKGGKPLTFVLIAGLRLTEKVGPRTQKKLITPVESKAPPKCSAEKKAAENQSYH